MILVTGATGFIGRHLLGKLNKFGHEIRVLSRDPSTDLNALQGIQVVTGNIDDPAILDRFVAPGATLINLAHANTTSSAEAIEATRLLVEKCAEKGIKRFIHCSSISVYGAVSGCVDENTLCRPRDEYGQLKYAIEQMLQQHIQNRFECVILRPTEVVGAGGRGLVKLTESLRHANALRNYLRSCLFSERNMHMVPVETVVDTIQFFIADQRRYASEVFIVSSDMDPLNNFQQLERYMFDLLGMHYYPIPPLRLPLHILGAMQRITNRSTIDLRAVYSDKKLREHGFQDSHTLNDSIHAFVQHNHNVNTAVSL